MCPHCRDVRVPWKKKGFFRRRRGLVQRYHCHGCRRTFSDQSAALTYREKKGHLDLALFRLLSSGMSQRRCAQILGLHRTTVARKLVRLGRRCRTLNARDGAAAAAAAAARADRHPEGDQGDERPGHTVVFDEMETFEHSKCKPLSVALAVTEGSRRILAVHVAQMPAKGRLAAIARKRYGPRADRRKGALLQLMADIKARGPAPTCLKSDQCPRYPGAVRRAFPGVPHLTFKGRRGCVVGQGELKAGGIDPLFSLNHTCAMFRDNVKRLSRKTWCTTKRPDRLQDLLDIYVSYHNAKVGGAKRPFGIYTGTLL